MVFLAGKTFFTKINSIHGDFQISRANDHTAKGGDCPLKVHDVYVKLTEFIDIRQK